MVELVGITKANESTHLPNASSILIENATFMIFQIVTASMSFTHEIVLTFTEIEVNLSTMMRLQCI